MVKKEIRLGKLWWQLSFLALLHLGTWQKVEAQVQQLRPAWSPTGRSYAFLSDKTGKYQVYLQDLQTNTSKRISNATEDVLQFKWSPTGQKIVYLSDGALVVMEDDGTEAMRLLTGHTNPLFFDWHPRGRGLTYSCAIKGESADICMKNLYNHFDINLTEHPALDRNFSWSPDGSMIAFGSDREDKMDIYLFDIRTQEVRRLTDLPGVTIDPVFSPDGLHIVFIADQDGTNQHFGVYVLNLELMELRLLSDTRGYNLPLWFPDGQSLLINTKRGGSWEFYRVKLDGSGREKLGQGLAFSIHPGGLKILTQSGESSRQQVNILNLK